MIGYIEITNKGRTMSFKYDKDNLFKEFKIAKEKDIALSKKTTTDDKENDIHINRIQFMKDHIELKKKNPSYYEFVDVNFDRLLIAYQSENPRNHFYKTIFGKTYEQMKAERESEMMNEYLGKADAV